MADQAERIFRRLLPDAENGRITHDQISLIAGLFDQLDVGLVSVDFQSDFANVNRTAANLLNIAPGNTTARRFHTVMADLAERALIDAEVVEWVTSLDTDPSAEFRSTWAFADSPLNLGVVSKPAPYPGFDGRIWAFYDNSALAQAIEASDHAGALWRAAADAMLDPQVLLEAVIKNGQIVDFIHRHANKAAYDYINLNREELIGSSLNEILPNLTGAGMMSRLIRCAQTGEPVILDDLLLYSDLLGCERYYDLRVSWAEAGWIVVTWRDGTDRVEQSQRIAASEERFRLLPRTSPMSWYGSATRAGSRGSPTPWRRHWEHRPMPGSGATPSNSRWQRECRLHESASTRSWSARRTGLAPV